MLLTRSARGVAAASSNATSFKLKAMNALFRFKGLKACRFQAGVKFLDPTAASRRVRNSMSYVRPVLGFSLDLQPKARHRIVPYGYMTIIMIILW